MGKRNIRRIMRQVKSDLGVQELTGHISGYSDDFNSRQNYAGIIIYGMDGSAKWYNESGQASGHRGRCFYVIIKNTAYFPDERAVGAGRVHFYPIEQVLGSEIEKQRVLCGGFAYHNGTLKFSSIWLNQNDQIGIGGSMAQTDDSKYLTDPEQVIVKYCFDQYKSHGSNITFTIPAHIERQII